MDTPIAPKPTDLFASADKLDERADAGEAQLAQERTAELARRSEERKTDTSAYMDAAKDAQSSVGHRQEVPMPNPDLGPPVDAKQFQSFASQLLTMALVGAAAGRGHWKTSVAALTGMVEGFKEGNEAKAKAKKEQFEREFKIAEQKQKEADKQYSDILESKKLSLNMQAKMIEIHAMANQDWDMAEKARQKDFEGMYRRADVARQRAETMKRHMDEMNFKWTTREDKRKAEAAKAGAGTSAWSPEAIDAIAETVVAGQPMPAMGSGTAAMKARGVVWQRVAEIAKERNIPLSQLPAARAQFSADKGSLAKLTQMADAVKAFENTALKNGDRLIELADKVDTTGSPVIERWIRAGRKEIAGDVDVNNFNAQIMLFGTEVAKILTNPTLSGQLTDNAREEVSQFAPKNATAAQVRGLVSLLKRDFENRRQAIDEQKSEITDRLRNIGTRGGEGGAARTAAGGPSPGAVEDGYRFKGGDPSKPENWEPVK